MNLALGLLMGAGMVLAVQLWMNDQRDKLSPVTYGGVRPAEPVSEQAPRPTLMEAVGPSWTLAHSREYPAVTTEPVETDWDGSLARMVYAGIGRVRRAATRALTYVARHARAVWDHPIVRHRRRWFGRVAKPYVRDVIESGFLTPLTYLGRHAIDVRLVESLLMS